MRLSLIWGVLIVIVNVHVLRSDPSINIEHMKKTEARNNTVKKHPAKLDHHHEFNHKKEFRRGKDLSDSDEKKKTETNPTKLTTDFVTPSTVKDNQKEKGTTILALATSNVTSITETPDGKHKEPKAEKVKGNSKKTMVEDEEDANVTKSDGNKEKESNKSTLKSEKTTDAVTQTDKDTATETTKASTMKEIQEESSKKKKIKSSEVSSEESEKSPKADAVKVQSTAEKKYKLQNRIEHVRSKKTHGRKERKKKFRRQNILIADEVVAESNGEASTIKPKVTTADKEESKPRKVSVTISPNTATSKLSATKSATGKSIADLEKELEDLENQYEDYGEYAVPDEEKVMGAQKAKASSLSIHSSDAKPISGGHTIAYDHTPSGTSIIGADGTFLPGGTANDATKSRTLQTKVTDVPTGKQGTPGAKGAGPGVTMAHDTASSATQKPLKRSQVFEGKELKTCRNNTDCEHDKYCMVIHGSTLRVCVDAKDAMRIYRDAVAYPHVEFPYENLLSRENKYQHCKMDTDCKKKLGNTGRQRCQNMACLGKICVPDPIEGCLSGFNCPNEFNCVHPRCASELQTGFGICLPLASFE